MIVSEMKRVADSPGAVHNILLSIRNKFNVEEQDKEHFYCLGLNRKNVCQFIDLVSIGTVSETIVHPREIFRLAIIKSCSTIIIAHNHPSGCTIPSIEDIHVTKRLKEGGELLGITLTDHIIFSESQYYSFKEEEHIL